MATSNTPQRGSAPPFSTSENDALYTVLTYTVGIDLQIRDDLLGPVRNFPLYQTTWPSRVAQQPNSPRQAGQSADM